MIGVIAGDIAGSRFERHNHRSKEFTLFTPECHFTDDSVLSLAVCAALLRTGGDTDTLADVCRACMREFGRRHPDCGFSSATKQWIFTSETDPYYSCGNGSAMRVSACAYAAESLDEVRTLAAKVTAISHNHPEGLKGAEAVACAVFLARTGKSAREIGDFISSGYYSLDFDLQKLRRTYRFDGTCQGSVPQAIRAFLDADSYEDAIRNAVSIGGDSDTIAAIAGSIAGPYFGIPENIRNQALTFLSPDLREALLEFETRFRISAAAAASVGNV